MHHIILYHPLRTISSTLQPRPGGQGPCGYSTVECSRNVPPDKAFHLYNQKAKQRNESGNIEMSDKNT